MPASAFSEDVAAGAEIAFSWSPGAGRGSERISLRRARMWLEIDDAALSVDENHELEIAGDGLRGRVIDFNLIYTTLRDDDGSLLQVPNNQFFQKPIRRIVGTETRTLDQQADREQPME